MASSAKLGAAVERDAILDAMEQSHEEIATTVATRLLSDVDGYQVWRSTDLNAQFVDQCREHILLLVRIARTGRAPTLAELEFVRQVGFRRADEMSPLHVLLQGYRLGHRVMWEWIVAHASPGVDGSRAALSLTGVTLEYLDLISATATAAYLERSQQLDLEMDRLKLRLLDDVLAGRLGLRDAAAARAAALGLNPVDESVVIVATLRAGPTQGTESLRQIAETFSHHLNSRSRPPFVVVRPAEVVAIVAVDRHGIAWVGQQLIRATEVLRRNRIMLVAAGVSTLCSGFAELSRGYAEALRALQYVPSAGGVVLLGDVPPFDYLIGLADRSARRIAPDWARRLVEEDRREAGMLIETLLAYLEADLRIGRTAQKLAVHPNTVQNRLRKVREITGRSTRRFGDLLQLITTIRLLRADRDAGVHFDQSSRQNGVHSNGSARRILDL